MTQSMRELAERLTALDDHTLAALFAARGIAAHVEWRDFFDAAEALSDPASLQRALTTLPEPALRALADGRRDADADRLMLTDAAGRPLPEVRRVLGEVLGVGGVGADSVGVAEEAGGEASAPLAGNTGTAGAAGALADAGAAGAAAASALAEPADTDAQAAAAERAFTSLDSMGDLLLAALHTPFGLLGSGALAAADRRRLAADAVRPDDVDALLRLATAAGLFAPEERMLLPTAAGEEWLQASTPQRWLRVARRLVAELPAALGGVGGRPWLNPRAWVRAYPADPAWPQRAEALREQAEAWGVLAADGSEPPWTRALREGSDDDAVVGHLRTALPQSVESVYLQNDLSAISPGPLASALDVRLRRMARRESHAQASSYRFTADAVAAALTEGETEESMLAFLAELSLTGVPQPLEYLVRTTAARHGSIRVGVGDDGRTRIDAPADVRATLAVDQTLRPLGLVTVGDALVSRVGRDAVLWSLVDARYPAVAVDAAGELEPLRRHRLAGPPAADVDPVVAYGPLIERLREADPADADAAWLGRELDSAVRSRATVEVVVELPDGSMREFTLEASGLGGGRLRGRERGTDIERTLPVSSLRRVRRM